MKIKYSKLEEHKKEVKMKPTGRSVKRE